MSNLTTLNRIKSLLVSSCDSFHQGNRDIAMNMMEIAMDEMQNLNPQDIEDGIRVIPVTDDHSDTTVSIENASFNDDLDVGNFELADFEMSDFDDSSAKMTFNNMIKDMISQTIK